MIEIKETIELFESNLAILSSLFDKGYAPNKGTLVPPTRVLPEGYEIRFVNNMDVSVAITFYQIAEGEDFFRVFVYGDNKKSFNLFNWLKYHEQVSDRSIFKFSQFSGNFSSQLKQLLARINLFLSDDSLEPILNGESWEEIPFDWAGMR